MYHFSVTAWVRAVSYTHLLVDGGKIVSYTAEPGYYTVDNSTAPSVFNGQLGDAVKETWERFKFSGSTPLQQKIYFINMQEIKNIAFGTVNPVSYTHLSNRGVASQLASSSTRSLNFSQDSSRFCIQGASSLPFIPLHTLFWSAASGR